MSNPRGVPYSPKRDAGVTRRNLEDPYRHAAKPPEPTVCPECKEIWDSLGSGDDKGGGSEE